MKYWYEVDNFDEFIDYLKEYKPWLLGHYARQRLYRVFDRLISDTIERYETPMIEDMFKIYVNKELKEAVRSATASRYNIDKFIKKVEAIKQLNHELSEE